MINLIPKEEKKKKFKSFYYRLVVVYLLSLSVCVLTGIIVLIPSYFIVFVKENSVDKKLEAQKKEPVPLPDQETLSLIKDLDRKLTLIERTESNKFDVSKKVIDAIIARKMPEIKISSISYENDPQKGKKVRVQGSAPSREILLLFRLSLESDVAFSQVDLPISNFVKGSNINFYISLIPS